MSEPLFHPGPRNLITDVDGLRVGNAQDHQVRTGVTVVLPDDPAVAGGDVRGGGPGTRAVDALDPTCLVDAMHGFVLSGGSEFGLASGDGVTNWLSSHQRGLVMGADGVPTIPVVPGAILFDLNNGGDKGWGMDPPYRDLGVAACEAAAAQGLDFDLGNAGAGMGAIAGKLKGGLGSASAVSDGGVQVGALVAANPIGSTVMPGSNCFWAWPFEKGGEFGGIIPSGRPQIDAGIPADAKVGSNTTICIVATNVELTSAQARRIAIMAHDGFARAVRPIHTPFDGDTVFALSTAKRPIGDNVPLDIARLGSVAADCVARAVARGVYEAQTLGDVRCYRDVLAAENSTGKSTGNSGA